ncbi:carboxylesterase family protein [Rutstroemia sp. NJR-2017a WRK4]|nr:carboxylesterase family protein [Rutstroemia sp. NJR-2017a WRK4]
MARVTRSSKICIAEDDTAFTAAQIPLPDTPTPKALAPTDLTGLNTMVSEDSEGLAIAQQMKNLKAAYRNALGMTKKGKKNKNRNKGRHGELADAEQIMGSIEQIENVDNTVGHLHPAGVTPNTAPLPISNEARGAGQYITGVSFNAAGDMYWRPPPTVDYLTSLFTGQSCHPLETGNFFQSGFEHSANSFVNVAMKDTVSDSKDAKASQSHFTQPILSENTHPVEAHMITPTKSKTKTLEEIERAHISKSYTDSTRLTAADEEEDSFIEQITSRSPAKPVSRIEDSLEEFDNLEDAIDAIDQATLAEQIVISSTKKKVSIADGVSPSREPRASPRRVMASKSVSIEAVEHSPISKSRTSSQRPHSTYATMRIKTTTVKEPALRRPKSMVFDSPKPLVERLSTVSPGKVTSPNKTPRPTSLYVPKQPVKSTKPPTKSNFELSGETVARRLKEQREARLAQRETSESPAKMAMTPKVKSSKPLTKPTAFELPGEALSRRKKEAHEAKLKAQEEEERKRREFKARPISTTFSSRTLPRDTAASRARQSKVGESSEVANLTVSKRSSIIGAHRPSIPDLQRANSSATRTRVQVQQPVRKPSPSHHGPAMSGLAMQRTVSEAEVVLQRRRAKELYDRDAKLEEEMKREKEEREAAAKRSREEAAERGRQASREWAEKQKAKRMGERDKRAVVE